jgi:hypothetical protein
MENCRVDNRLLNVNGVGYDALLQAIKFAFIQRGHSNDKCGAYVIDPKYGLILFNSHIQDLSIPFPVPMETEEIASLVFKWVNTANAKSIPHSKWCDNKDHDGSNESGWQVYCEDWGHIGTYTHPICAIKHAYIWYGK